jgi:hypothetical protein
MTITSCLAPTRGDTIAHFFRALSLNFFLELLVVVASDFVPRCCDGILKVTINLLDNNFLAEIMLAAFTSVQSIKQIKKKRVRHGALRLFFKSCFFTFSADQ